MEDNIDIFNKRWNAIESETLSAVRKQLTAYSFNQSEVNRNFQKSCDEWFNGKLGPSIWYKNLRETQPEKSQTFKDYILRIRLYGTEMSKPSKWWAYLSTTLSLPITYFTVDYVTDWTLLGQSVFTIGIGVLVWYSCQARISSQHHKYEEKIVSHYQQQLEKQKEKLIQILS